MHILITGAAGFIGSALAWRLLERGERVTGLDNLNDYYDVRLKEARLARTQRKGFDFIKGDIADREAMANLFAARRFDAVVHLAAQAGVRHSIEQPLAYIDANLVGFAHVLEGCRHGKVGHLVFASSSSVYGSNGRLPFSEHDNVDHPISLYAATKKANELMAHSYAHLFRLPCTGLRFFTVYGPWGRPDMAYFSFTRKIMNGEPIPVFAQGELRRDFTYIADIVEGVVRLLFKPTPAQAGVPAHSVFNIGNHQPVRVMDFIATLEQVLGRKAVIEFLPMQPGDVPATYADTNRLRDWVGFAPATRLADGLAAFSDWYNSWSLNSPPR